jgi:hypothetical protein
VRFFLSCADLNKIGLLRAGRRRTPLMKSAAIKRWLRREQLATLHSSSFMRLME